MFEGCDTGVKDHDGNPIHCGDEIWVVCINPRGAEDGYNEDYNGYNKVYKIIFEHGCFGFIDNYCEAKPFIPLMDLIHTWEQGYISNWGPKKYYGDKARVKIVTEEGIRQEFNIKSSE